MSLSSSIWIRRPAPHSGSRGRPAAVADAPNGVADVVGDYQCTGSVNCNAHGPPARVALGVDEPRDEVHRLADGLAAGERNKHHAITIELAPVPATVLAHESTATEHRGEG